MDRTRAVAGVREVMDLLRLPAQPAPNERAARHREADVAVTP